MKKIGLFIPCYVDQCYPRVGMATAEILEQLGLDVAYPTQQTCCGQPMANTGCTNDAEPLARAFVDLFSPFDYVVSPSGSCVAMVRQHYHEYFHHDPTYEALRLKTFELSEFLTDVMHIEKVIGHFPFQLGLHASCHGLRELRLGQCSEVNGPKFNKAQQLLAGFDGISFSTLQRPDECCGFGGTFAVNEEAVSCMMGNDRLHDHATAGSQVLTAGDMSCLMHLQGLLQRQKNKMPVMHMAEILAGYQPDGTRRPVEFVRGAELGVRS